MPPPRSIIDLTGIMSDNSDSAQPPSSRPKKSLYPHGGRPSGQRRQQPISPPALGRSVTASGRGSRAPILSQPAPRSYPGLRQSQGGDGLEFAGFSVKENAVPAWKNAQAGPSPTQCPHTIAHKSAKQPMPKKVDWNAEKLEDALRRLSKDLGAREAEDAARFIQSAWKRGAPQPVTYSKKNWFADMNRTLTEAGPSALKVKLKMGPGRTGKQEKREHYEVIAIKTDQESVPKYGFHHVEITRNILSPHTRLGFVPHLRDLADGEEPEYRRWLENLESMDEKSGFLTLGRPEKELKTLRTERAATLLSHLDFWLGKLAIEGCTRATLIHHMATQTDIMTPNGLSNTVHLHGGNGATRSAKGVRMFIKAFDKAFNDINEWHKSAITLRDVLLLDNSLEPVLDTGNHKSTDEPSQLKPTGENMSWETCLDTYSSLGCLICASHSCEHGEYDLSNNRKRFSLELVGGLTPLAQVKAVRAALLSEGQGPFQEPCNEDCYLHDRPGTRVKPWSDTEVMLLETSLAFLCDHDKPVQCVTAFFISRPCWDVDRQLKKMDLQLPAVPPSTRVSVKPVYWYDRYKKTLHADWQDQTVTHEHHKKDHFDPCSHDGPCTKANCDCAKNNVMCERFCRCTAATCAIKFTGCACHLQGKTCLPRQKGERPCICIQLNRECDPKLCGTCGVVARADPANAHDDQLFEYGCQNCALQRGQTKNLAIGKSTVEGCGYGLFAAEDIAQDDFVIEYVGELITQDEGVRREARRGNVFDAESYSSYLFTLLEEEGIWVDAALYGNLSRYINHQDDWGKAQGCNITPTILYVEHEYRIKFSALRDIKSGEELFFNYGAEFPNLTKRLLDEQKAEEEVNEQRAIKEITDLNNGQTKPKDKKRGRRPKKSFGARPDSDLEDVVSNKAGSTNSLPQDFDDSELYEGKRYAPGHDSDEGDYRQEMDADETNKTSHFTLQDQFLGHQLRHHTNTKAKGAIEGTGLVDRESEIAFRVRVGVHRAKMRRSIKEDDDEDEIDEELDAEFNGKELALNSKRSKGNIARGRAATTNSIAEQDTLTHPRTRAPRLPEGSHSKVTPVPIPSHYLAHIDQKPGSSSASLAPTAPRKRGRPRKVQRDEIADTDDNTDETSVGGSTLASNKFSQNTADDSDSSNGSGNRRRIKRQRSRYND